MHALAPTKQKKWRDQQPTNKTANKLNALRLPCRRKKDGAKGRQTDRRTDGQTHRHTEEGEQIGTET